VKVTGSKWKGVDMVRTAFLEEEALETGAARRKALTTGAEKELTHFPLWHSPLCEMTWLNYFLTSFSTACPL
jgi:hypothetical protein